MGIYKEAFQHFVWATRRREHFITPDIERDLYRCLRYLCEEAHVQIHALNGMPDHVHLVVTLLPETEDCLYWQEGYGWLTFTQDDLPRAIRYIDHQKEHHATSRLSPKMERAADWEQLPIQKS